MISVNEIFVVESDSYMITNKIKLTLAISSGVRAPFMSCLFASISKDAPDSLC